MKKYTTILLAIICDLMQLNLTYDISYVISYIISYYITNIMIYIIGYIIIYRSLCDIHFNAACLILIYAKEKVLTLQTFKLILKYLKFITNKLI